MTALAPGKLGAFQSRSMMVGPAATALRLSGAEGVPVLPAVTVTNAGIPGPLAFTALTRKVVLTMPTVTGPT